MNAIYMHSLYTLISCVRFLVDKQDLGKPSQCSVSVTFTPKQTLDINIQMQTIYLIYL